MTASSSVVTMHLNGASLGNLFPVYGRTMEKIRLDEQGTSINRIKITLSGFLEATSNSTLMALYATLKGEMAINDCTFTYTTDSITLHNNQQCWIESYQEPEDTTYAKNASGDYSITLYWFEDNGDSLAIACTYNYGNLYTFAKTPTWGRDITINRQSHRAVLVGSTATINLSGILYGSTHTALMTAIGALSAAFTQDGILTYGAFSQSVHVVKCRVQPVTMKSYAIFDIEVMYDIGAEVSLSRKVSFSRLHNNPLITEQPFCDSRLVELFNPSAQYITYNIAVTSSDLATARDILATEAQNLVQPGGLEMQGGTEDWDYDEVSVDVKFTKFYNTPVLLNLAGT